MPTAIPTLDGTNKIVGFKVPSPIATSGDIAWHSSGIIPYRSTASNLSEVITSNNELLLSNGGFITPASTLISPEIGYGNYGAILGNTSLNYSTITTTSPARLTTFAWAIPPATPGTGNISSFKLEVIFSDNTTISQTGAEIVLNGKSGGLNIDYRIEDRNAPDSVPSSSWLNTVWISGNTTAGGRTAADGANSTNIGGSLLHGQVVAPSYSGKIATYNLIIPTQGIGSNKNTLIYTRFALNSDVNARIISIKASLI